MVFLLIDFHVKISTVFRYVVWDTSAFLQDVSPERLDVSYNQCAFFYSIIGKWSQLDTG